MNRRRLSRRWSPISGRPSSASGWRVISFRMTRQAGPSSPRMAERAGAGVEVRLMVDALGSFNTPTGFFAPLLAAGVQVHFFHALARRCAAREFVQTFNQRNHRKLLIVDDSIAYFGGMNVVDQSGIHSKADAKARHLPASAGWRDVHVRLVGPRQARNGRGVRLAVAPRASPSTGKAAGLAACNSCLPAGRTRSFFSAPDPRSSTAAPQRVFVPLIQRAQREITLVDGLLPADRSRASGVDPGASAGRESAGDRSGAKRRQTRAVGHAALLRVPVKTRHPHLRAARPDAAQQGDGDRRPMVGDWLLQSRRRAACF